MSIRRPGSPTCCAALPIIPPGGCTSCCPGTGTRRRSGTPSPRKIPRCRACRLHAVSPRPRPDAYGQHAADRSSDPAALGRGLEFGDRLALRRQSRREQLPVPVAGDDAPAVARQFVGELLGIADAEDLRARISAETPRGEGDRGQVRLQMARRQVDDQPADPAFEDRQFRGDDLEMPAERTPNLRVQLAKSTPRKAREIKPQRRTLFFPGGIGAAPTGLSLVGACRSKPYLSG